MIFWVGNVTDGPYSLLAEVFYGIAVTRNVIHHKEFVEAAEAEKWGVGVMFWWHVSYLRRRSSSLYPFGAERICGGDGGGYSW